MALLPTVMVHSRISQSCAFSGMDQPTYCADPDHFENYPNEIYYHYNQRGFRDLDWPEATDELKNAIWCVGDSFTKGVGQPWANTWPQRLLAKLGTRTINVSLDGASNQWISRVAVDILRQVQPRNMVIMWSYIHRRESDDTSRPAEDRVIHCVNSTFEQDLDLLLECLQQVKNHEKSTCIVHTAIPGYRPTMRPWTHIRKPDWPHKIPGTVAELNALPQHIQDEIYSLDFLMADIHTNEKIQNNTRVIEIINQLDRARDGHHFDCVTADWIVEQIVPQLRL